MRRFLLFFICLLGVTAVFGQFKSRLGRFEVDNVKGCAPFDITITTTNLITTGECTPGKACLMDFEGKGTSSTNTFTYRYTTPGTYKLSVLYQSIGADDITVTVTDNPEPVIEIYRCTGNQITLRVVDKVYDTYIIDFNNDNTPEITIPNGNNATALHNYGAPGTYTVAVRGRNVNSANNCVIKREATTMLIPPPPMPQPSLNVLTAVDANTLKLDMTTTPQIQYKLEIGQNSGTNFQVLQNLYQVNTINIPNLLLDNNYYCFRMSAFDACAGTNTYSNTICSQDFEVKFNNGVNSLEWRTFPSGVTTTEIKRNGGTYTNVPGSPMVYGDLDYDCNEQYCYQIVSHYAGGRSSTSLTKCGIGRLETTFPAIENISSVVRDGVELKYDADDRLDIENFEIMKSELKQPYFQVALTKEEFYRDATYVNDGQICYQVNYGDKCGNKSLPGIIACPISLEGTLADNNAVTLTWNKYKGYTNGVAEYQIKKYTAQASLLDTFTTTDTTIVDYDPADNNQVVIYAVTAIAVDDGMGIEESISNNITIEKPVRLILPTAFTPNGDGINPLFSISGKFVSKLSIQIFDRWGVLVFTSDKNEPWDGTRGGKVMPESAYVWRAEVSDFAGNTFTREGTVLLLRPPR